METNVDASHAYRFGQGSWSDSDQEMETVLAYNSKIRCTVYKVVRFPPAKANSLEILMWSAQEQSKLHLSGFLPDILCIIIVLF